MRIFCAFLFVLLPIFGQHGTVNLQSFRQAGTGAVVRSAEDKLRETITILDYGADPTGVADSTIKFQAALVAGTGKQVVIPPGNYLVSSTLTLPEDTHVIGAASGRALENGLGVSRISFTSLNTPLFNCTKNRFAIRGLTLNQIGVAVSGSVAITTDGSGGENQAYNFNLEDLDISSFYNGLSITASNDARLDDIQVHSSVSAAIVNTGATGTWVNIKAISNNGHGVKILAGSKPGPKIYGLETFNNNGYGLYATGSFWLDGFYINNDAYGGIYAAVANYNAALISNGIVEYAGLAISWPNVPTAPSIYLDSSTTPFVTIQGVDSTDSNGNGIDINTAYTTVTGCHVRVPGVAAPTDANKIGIRVNGGQNTITGNQLQAAGIVCILCTKSIINGNNVLLDSATLHGIYLKAGTDVILANNMAMNLNAAGPALLVDAGVTLNQAANIFPSGTVSNAGTRSPYSYQMTELVAAKGTFADLWGGKLTGIPAWTVADFEIQPFSDVVYMGIGFYSQAGAEQGNTVFKGSGSSGDVTRSWIFRDTYNDGGSPVDRLTINVLTGVVTMTAALNGATNLPTLSADSVFNNNIKLGWKDSVGTTIPTLWLDGSNNFHVGVQAAPASAGDMVFYARGDDAFKVTKPTANFYIEPIDDHLVYLGTVTKRFDSLRTMFVEVFSDSATGRAARLDLQTADQANTLSLLAAAVGGGTYNIYFPAAPPGAASKILATTAATSNPLAWVDLPTGTVTAVTGASPIVSSGGAAPEISCATCVTTGTEQTISGLKTFTSLLTAHDIYPSAAATYTLGSSTYPWKELHLDTGLYMGASQVMNADRDLVNIVDATMSGVLSGTTSFTGHWLPTTTLTYNLGSADYKWLGLHVGTITFYTGLYAPGGAGTDATITCAVNQWIKSITVSKGIVTAVSCGGA